MIKPKADNVIDHKEAINLIHEIIGYFSKGDYPIMVYSNSGKVKKKL